MPCMVIQPMTGFLPSGMTKNGTQTWPLSTAGWVAVTAWTANTGTYPGSSVSSDKCVVQGSKSGSVVSASIAFTGGLGTRTIRLVDQSGNVLATGTGATSSPATVSAPAQDLSGITSIGVEMSGSSPSSGGTVTSGATSFLTIT
jgi:hypothetical protein